MNSFAPLVSIVIPVYNGANYLAEAIDSALAQTYSNIEVLVINDGSKDNEATRNIALSYGNQIRYFEKENGGVATALNLGIAEMKGEYFSWLSHDDKYFPQKIETQIKFLTHLSDKEIVLYSDIEYIDKNSHLLSQLRFPNYPAEKFRPAFIKGGLINGCTLLVPKICFEKYGLFDISLRTTQDYDLWFRFSETFDFFHQPEILIQSRLHENQDTVKLQDTAYEERDRLQLHFIKNVTKEEIELFSEGNAAGYYIKFAYMMEFSMLLKAEKYTIQKAIQNILRPGLLPIFRNILKLILLIVIMSFRKVFVLFFGFNSYQKFKQMIWNYRLKLLH